MICSKRALSFSLLVLEISFLSHQFLLTTSNASILLPLARSTVVTLCSWARSDMLGRGIRIKFKGREWALARLDHPRVQQLIDYLFNFTLLQV